MDEQQIREIIVSTLDKMLPAALGGAVEQLQKYVDEKVPKIPEAQDEPLDPKDPLTARLAKLEAELKAAGEREQQRIQEAKEAQLSSKLLSDVTAKGVSAKHAQFLVDALLGKSRLDLTEKDGEYYTKDGSKLSEHLDMFFTGEVGSHFIPASGAPSGTGTPKPTQVNPKGQPSVKDISLDEMLLDVAW